SAGEAGPAHRHRGEAAPADRTAVVVRQGDDRAREAAARGRARGCRAFAAEGAREARKAEPEAGDPVRERHGQTRPGAEAKGRRRRRRAGDEGAARGGAAVRGRRPGRFATWSQPFSFAAPATSTATP